MPARIGGFVPQPIQSSADRRDLGAIRDRLVSQFNQHGAIGGAAAQALINESMRDGKLTQAEAGFLAESFAENSHVFTPEGAQVLNQFLGQYGLGLGDASLPPLQAPQAWMPTPSAGWEHPDLTTLRQNIGQLLDSGRPISGSDAQLLMNRAMKSNQIAPQGMQILSETFARNPAAFSNEATMLMNNFLTVNQPRSATPVWGQPAAPSYGRPGDGFQTGAARPVPRAEYNQLTSLRDAFTRLMTNDGVVSPREVQSLLNQAATDGRLTHAKLNLLAQGFSDNQGRFTGDAAGMMRDFLNQYGVY